jgi:peptide/nickel transport system ATP-binding protein
MNPSVSCLLEVEGLSVQFKSRRGCATVLDDVRLSLRPGETLGIVGESGCGKSMTALAVMRLIPSPPGRIAAGKVLLKGEDLLSASEARMRQIRGNAISMIFQEPMTSLNPVLTIGEQIGESLRLHRGLHGRSARPRVVELLKAVGIPAAEQRVAQYPHQLSGGMRQRVMIAMALACEPAVLIADEPTTALDVTVQAQIFDLLRELQEKHGTAIVLITHDMGVISEMAHRVMVMYGGRVVEDGPCNEILEGPRHPYTQGLISCLPRLGAMPSGARERLAEIPGVVPSIWELQTGCPFARRCASAMDRCTAEMPPSYEVSPGHRAACWLHRIP